MNNEIKMQNSDRRNLFYIGAAAALLQLAATLAAVIVNFSLGGRPETVQEFFNVYQQNKFAGILRDEFPLVLLIGLYLLSFPALYAALKKVSFTYSMLASLFTFVAVTICFASHSGFSMLHLSEQYAAASSETQRMQLLAAGEAILASDMWNSTASYMTGLLLQGAGVIISLVMLRSKDFSKVTAYCGLLGNAFDLIQHIMHPFTPSFSATLLYLAGPFYFIWYPMLARDLFRLGRAVVKETESK